MTSTTSAHRVRALTVVLACGAVAAVALLDRLPARSGVPALPAVLIGLLFLLAGCTQMHVEFGRQTWSHTLSELALVIGLFCTAPAPLALASGVGGGLAMLIKGQRQPAKLLFNTFMFTCEAAAATLVQRALLPDPAAPLGPRAWLATYAAVLASSAFTLLAVLTAIRCTRGPLRRGDLVALPGPALLSAMLNATIALVGLLTVRVDTAAVGLLAVAAVGFGAAYRSYSVLLRRHSSLDLVNQFTRAVGRLDAGGVEPLLAAVRRTLSAERAELLLPLGEGRVERTSAGEDTFRQEEVPLGWLPARVLETGTAVLVGRGTRDDALRAWLDAEGVRDAVLVPLPGEDGSAGVLMVGERQGSSSRFRRDDVTVLETLAAHVAVALDNGKLVVRLRHEALHDRLTGLPNRSLLVELTASALRADRERDDGARTAVAVIDLDGIKEVNDTLGHHSGDALLLETGLRLTAAATGWPCVARVGGAEFAVLLPPTSGDSEAPALVRELLAALDEPLVLDRLELSVRASAGVAASSGAAGGPDEGTSAGDEVATLLRRADMAMYAAKAAGDGVRLFTSDLDSGSLERLAMAGELRRAIDAGDIEVHFQPKALVTGGRVCGVEALARWNHPVRGAVPPDVFVALAEQTGLVGGLTRLVLRRAVEQCAAWRTVGLDVGVAVNLSARSLTDSDLAGLVAAELRAAGLPPQHLTLEITESSVMSEPARTLPVLHALADLGLRLSVDDFGTGHSSLSYLQRLPVSEVKVDKSFVHDLGSDAVASAIVRAVVDLGHSLGLTVVAEGVEDEPALAELRVLGCDVVQGWLLARALSPADATRFLHAALSSTLPHPTVPVQVGAEGGLSLAV